MSDVSTIRKLKRKDEEIFSKVFYQYRDLVFYECYSVLNNRTDAEDITQNVFIEFFNKIDNLDDHSNLKLHLAGLAKRRAIDEYRRKSSSNNVYSEDLDIYGEEEKSRDATDEINSLHKHLDKDEAHIVALRVIYEYSFKEIADHFQQTIGVIQGKYYFAIKKLKNYYKKKGS